MTECRWTVGIEEEYQLVDATTGALAGAAPEVLGRIRAGDAEPELQRTMLEIATPAADDIGAALREVEQRRRWASRAAAEHGLAIAAAGLHPDTPTPADQLTDDPHYIEVGRRGGLPARELHIFGLHVHVAVPDRDSAIRAMRFATPHIPALLALSASSPFHLGRDTEFSSFRTVLRDMFPRVGPPMPVATAAEYNAIQAALGGGDGATGVISWDIRPSDKYPTLEFRFFDVNPTLETVGLLAALARSLTRIGADVAPCPGNALEQQAMRENRWRAARLGLDASLVVPGAADLPIGAALRALRDTVCDAAAELGDAAALGWLEEVLRSGGAAARMRAAYRAGGSLAEVTRWVCAETMRGAGATDPPPPRSRGTASGSGA